MDIREDEWLAEVFGHPVFAVAPEAAAALADHAAANDRGLYYAKVPTERTDQVRELEDAGLHVVDVNVTLSRDGAAPSQAEGANVRPLGPADADAVLEIAGSCFRYSRFHLDPFIPRETADRVKREWVASYVAGRRGEELLVAHANGRPAGFLAVLGDRDARVIDLVGVAEDRSGRGIGSALVAAFIERHGAAASELRVGTQIANVPSLSLYARFGFRVASSAYVLHGYLGSTT
jgi:ribosomal protein S18 acetylase RimI-like enzyme